MSLRSKGYSTKSEVKPHASRFTLHASRFTLHALLLGLLCLFLTAPSALAQTATPEAQGQTPPERVEVLEARVLSATQPGSCGAPATPAPEETSPITSDRCQEIELLVTKGSIQGQKVVVQEGRIPIANKAGVVYKAGDVVLVDWYNTPGEPEAFYITDFVRTDGLLILAVAFVVLAIILGGVRGLTSFLGLVISFVVLLFFVVPRIIAGDDPLFISIVGAFAIMFVTLYLSHGFNLKTTAALAGTSISLIITGLLAWLAVDFSRLSGFGSEEAFYVQIAQGGTINLRGLLLGGIIIGALGVLDDITISQSAASFELHNAAPHLTWQSIFRRAINIGRDHIAATVNTLVLAYAGASLPLLILFVAGNEGWDSVINREIVAEEVVRTLVGSIGLIASVPITTLLASILAVRTPVQPPKEGDVPAGGHGHHHH